MILVLSKMSPNCQKFSRHHLCMAGDYLAQPCTASLQRSENYSGSLVLGPEISLTIGCMNMRGKNCVVQPAAGWRAQFFSPPIHATDGK